MASRSPGLASVPDTVRLERSPRVRSDEQNRTALEGGRVLRGAPLSWRGTGRSNRLAEGSTLGSCLFWRSPVFLVVTGRTGLAVPCVPPCLTSRRMVSCVGRQLAGSRLLSVNQPCPVGEPTSFSIRKRITKQRSVRTHVPEHSAVGDDGFVRPGDLELPNPRALGRIASGGCHSPTRRRQVSPPLRRGARGGGPAGEQARHGAGSGHHHPLRVSRVAGEAPRVPGPWGGDAAGEDSV